MKTYTIDKVELIKLLEDIYQLGIESTYSKAKGISRDKKLDRIKQRILKTRV